MDLRKLEAFAKVYELRSFSKAGEALYLSQPTVSAHVATLEDRLGVKLFDRLGRTIMPTEAGNVLFRSTETIFRELQNAKASIEMIRDQVVGELSVGASTIPALHILPPVLAAFSERHPQVTYALSEGDTSRIVEGVHDGVLSVGIVGTEPSEPGLAAIRLLEDDVVVAAPAKASFLKRRTGKFSFSELAGLPWILRRPGSATRKHFNAVLEQCGLGLHDVFVRALVADTGAAVSSVANGLGLTMTSRLAVRKALESGDVVLLDVPELVSKRSFYLVYNEARQMLPALRSFVEFAIKHSERILRNV
ncbi:selenium metabolism-associated LysR family transcriptional regulator [Pseudodesulfovibrio tunisiensis]|uniref:selenium metabolism-associated LysR family transcriptional regulator n=1 Tax=Pseudodesulfovibrio tunisiensis TaxID=463192 RepID=UPI001FB4DCA3|nr:selenium metabolism-associated LysR family transcriptional regulator [Pseudodesulfovibrio tunisiensis]